MPNEIEIALNKLRQKLLSTDTRNRLVHVNLASTRSNCLNVINEKTDEIYNILLNRSMRFKATAQITTDNYQEMLLALPDENITDSTNRLTDNYIETPLDPEALAYRLLRLAGAAKTAEEERDLNILYLAMGFLSWKENTTSTITREAPLVLLPVRLERSKNSFVLNRRGNSINTNLSLQERLKQDFGIDLPDVEEEDGWVPSKYFNEVKDAISTQPSWAVRSDVMQLGLFSFAKLLMYRDLDINNWPEDSLMNPLLTGLLVKGFHHDEPYFRPEDKLDDLLDPAEIIQVIDADASQTKVIEEVRHGTNLVVQGPPGTGKSQTITNIIAAAVHDKKSVLFVAEKMAALSVVHNRLKDAGLGDICLELHSHTANKKVFYEELGKTLKNSTPRRVQLQNDLDNITQLRQTRDELNKITQLLHTQLRNNSGTPFQAVSEMIYYNGKGSQPPSIPPTGLENLSSSERSRALDAISDMVEVLGCFGLRENHPFRGVTNLDLLPPDLPRLKQKLTDLIKAVDVLLKKVLYVAESTHQQTPHSFFDIKQLCSSLRIFYAAPDNSFSLTPNLFYHLSARTKQALEMGAKWLDAKREVAHYFTDASWQTDVSALRTPIANGRASWISRLSGRYRKASRELDTLLSGSLPKSPAMRLELVDRLLHVQSLASHFSNEEAWLYAVLGSDEWRGELTPFSMIYDVVCWLEKVCASAKFSNAGQVCDALSFFQNHPDILDNQIACVEQACSSCTQTLDFLGFDFSRYDLPNCIDNVDLNNLRKVFIQMASDVSRYQDWLRIEHAIKKAYDEGASSIVDAISNAISPLELSNACDEYSYACAEARWKSALNSLPGLKELLHTDRSGLVSRFNKLETDRIASIKSAILSTHSELIFESSSSSPEMVQATDLIIHETQKRRRHKDIRWIVRKSGEMVQSIKPVMLMSPISVAQFLPPGELSFDLLVIDEASQMRPENALGVIMRSKQMVIVGDQKQLPPTSFFDRQLGNDDEENDDDYIISDVANIESILDLCESRQLPQRMLEWHYRSRDPSLIRVSNTEFYDDRLVLPPSPLENDDNYGLQFRRVNGSYAVRGSGVGRSGTNQIEAEKIVDEIVTFAEHDSESKFSLGVVAFSKAQADMLTDILELRRRANSVLDDFLKEGKPEDFFIKNIENVQGDERDVIFISVGYGPQTPGGQLTHMRFGPINNDGGDRRLNVLFTRSRVRCLVFASFDPGDLDVTRATHRGLPVLKRFLDFAQKGHLDSPYPTGLAPDSPFEIDVAQEIRNLGFIPELQVGTAGFRIDIGIRHPDRPSQYILAVECDGATYHSALWARERDRHRQMILENLGWHFHRIWSTDWFYHRSDEIQKLSFALTRAYEKSLNNIIEGANSHYDHPVSNGSGV